MVIYTNEGILDIYEGINYPFNYAIGDVRDITKRNIDFSKTIKLPATKNNNKFFEYFFNVNVQSGSFDVNKKEFIRVEENGNVVFEGFLQLLSVTLQDGFNYYEGVVFSSFRNILDIVQGLDLSDLDFSEYNHPYTVETFQGSVYGAGDNTGRRLNYKYYSDGSPFSSYIDLGYGYVYPFISYNGTVQDYDFLNPLEDYPNAYPAFFVNEYIEKIFLLAGYKIESKFFETEYFKRLILPFTNGVLGFTEEENNKYTVNYSQASYDYGLFVGSSIIPTTTTFILQNDTLISDDENQYNITNDTITFVKETKFNLKVEGTLNFVFDDTSAGNKKIYRGGTDGITLTLKNLTNPQDSLEREIILTELTPDFDDLINNTFTLNFSEVFNDFFASVDDKYQIEFTIANGFYYYKEFLISLPEYLPFNLDATNTSFKLQFAEDATLQLGDDLSVSKTLPKLKITDFLKSIITMFNLYIYPKQDALNTLIIETRDEFYTGNKTHFFDSKLDKSKPIKISTLSEESAKTYLYKYKEGKDYINQEYDAANDGKKYAQKEVITDNQFLTNTQSYTTVFAASGNRFIDNFNAPIFFDREGNDVDGYEDKTIKLEPRILFYGGNGFAGSFETLNYPTFSLDFEAMKQTSDADEWIPYFDLYNLFHKNTIEEVSSPNAKLLTCYLDLNVAEINIADKIYILGEYWRINKIIDYNANSNDTTKVELFKLKGNVNYLTAETIITDYENNTSLFNDKFNNQFS